jgi:hypothetical protein
MMKRSAHRTKYKTANVWKLDSGNKPVSSGYRSLPYSKEFLRRRRRLHAHQQEEQVRAVHREAQDDSQTRAGEAAGD